MVVGLAGRTGPWSDVGSGGGSWAGGALGRVVGDVLRSLPLALLILLVGCRSGEPGPGEDDDDLAADDDTAPDDDDAIDDDDATDDDDSMSDDDDLLPEPWPPEAALFRTQRESFNERWYVALVDGRIHVRPNVENGEEPGDWELLGSTGLPDGSDLPNFGPPGELVAISADGIHLQALSGAGAFYRGVNLTEDVHQHFEWTDRWGGVGASGPGLLQEFGIERGWSVSDSHPFGVASYEDTNGTQHSVGAGVAHLYRLGPAGRRIYFNDWWLPNDWSRQLCGPERGTFRSTNISVSASTMMLVGERGELYTRLYDFDTGGENSLLTYSYIIPGASGTTRKLPAEGWLRQPDISSGLITSRITIFQNGEGNAARVLRVEGVRDGVPGFFHKPIYGDEWAFQQTDRQVTGPFLNDPDAEPPAPFDPPDDRHLAGTLSLDWDTVGLELLDFNVVCSPARALLLVDGEPVTVGGAPLELPFHHVHTMVFDLRPADFWLGGVPAEVQAALLVSDAIDAIDDPSDRATVQELFGDREVVNFVGQVGTDFVDLGEITWTMPFRVPAEEKAFWSAFELSLGAAR